MGVINTEQLDKVNEQLEGIISLLDSFFENLQKQIDAAPDKAYQIAQAKCDELSANVNQRGKAVRQKCIDFLKPQMAKITEKIQPIMPLVAIFQGGISADFGAIIDALMLVLEIIIAPYQPYIELLSTLPPKLVTLSTNLQKLATYQPNLKMPEGVPMPSMSVSVEPITMGDIM